MKQIFPYIWCGEMTPLHQSARLAASAVEGNMREGLQSDRFCSLSAPIFTQCCLKIKPGLPMLTVPMLFAEGR